MVWLKPHPIFGHPNAPFEVACPCVQTDRRRQYQTQNEAIQLHLLAFRSSDIYVYIYVYTCICTYVHIPTSNLHYICLHSHVTGQIEEAFLLAFVLCTTLAHNLANNLPPLTWLLLLHSNWQWCCPRQRNAQLNARFKCKYVCFRNVERTQPWNVYRTSNIPRELCKFRF